MASFTLCCVRHGQSVYNVADESGEADPLTYDAELTAKGRAQTALAGAILKDVRATLPSDSRVVVMVSPLRRALRTAKLALPEDLWRQAVVLPCMSEHLTASCDIGSPSTALQAEFPDAQLSGVGEQWWYVPPQQKAMGLPARRYFEEYGIIEPHGEFRARVTAFLAHVAALVGKASESRTVGDAGGKAEESDGGKAEESDGSKAAGDNGGSRAEKSDGSKAEESDGGSRTEKDVPSVCVMAFAHADFIHEVHRQLLCQQKGIEGAANDEDGAAAGAEEAAWLENCEVLRVEGSVVAGGSTVAMVGDAKVLFE